jgi:hypothetical protein
LCQNGLPTGDLYEFAALQVLKFEKRWRQNQRKQHIKARVGGEEEGKKSLAEPSEATPARTTGKGKPEPVHEEAKRAHGEDKKRPGLEEGRKTKEEAKKAANEPVLSKKPTTEALPKKPVDSAKKAEAKQVQDQPARAEESPKRRPEEAKGKKK